MRNVLNVMKKLSSTPASPKKPPSKKPPAVELPEIALAAVASYKRQKEVSDFIDFLLAALERNADWLNTMVDKQNNFKCALMVGSGPNRFTLQEIIYPCGDNEIKLEVEMKDSEDYDKIAIAALLRLTNYEMDQLLKYVKTRMNDNMSLREDMVRGKALGISFAVLRPFSEKQYRVMERIVIGSSLKCIVSDRKRKKNEFYAPETPLLKKARKVV